MRILHDERGVALVTTLLLSAISLIIIMSVLYYISRGTELSAMNKKYKSSLEASYGGVELEAKNVIPDVYANMAMGDIKTKYGRVDLFLQYTGCVRKKVTQNTESWSSACSTTRDAKENFDLKFVLDGTNANQNYVIYAKIVDTFAGNSDGSAAADGSFLESSRAVTSSSDTGGSITPMHIPARYRIELQGENERNPNERSRLSVLYAY